MFSIPESVQDKLRVTFGIGEDVKMRFWQHDMTKTYVLIRNTTQKVVEHGRQVGGQVREELAIHMCIQTLNLASDSCLAIFTVAFNVTLQRMKTRLASHLCEW